ncbi:MAG: zinc metallopeptidase [Saprospiraceae bacterium]
MGFIIILGIFSVIGWFVSSKLKSKFAYYSKIPLSSGMSGYEVGMAMMKYYNVSNVTIIEGKGRLTDHYNPSTRIVALSPEVYHGRSVASAAVAAHEVGHVVQHSKAYSFLTLRSNLVPIVQFSSRIQQFLFLGFILGVGTGILGQWLILIITASFGITALFTFITLPVEFDASRRALVWLESTGITVGEEYEGAKDSLWWAAMTYVAKALSALVMFVYFLLMIINKK